MENIVIIVGVILVGKVIKKGNTNHAGTHPANAVIFETMFQSLYPLGIIMSYTFVTTYIIWLKPGQISQLNINI